MTVTLPMPKWHHLRAINSRQPDGMTWLKLWSHFFQQKVQIKSFLNLIIHLANTYRLDTMCQALPSTGKTGTDDENSLGDMHRLLSFILQTGCFSRIMPQSNQTMPGGWALVEDPKWHPHQSSIKDSAIERGKFPFKQWSWSEYGFVQFCPPFIGRLIASILSGNHTINQLLVFLKILFHQNTAHLMLKVSDLLKYQIREHSAVM